MSSLISSFHNVTFGLQQDQLALTATADNISNQNTAGYARRIVTWSSGDTVTLNGKPSVQPSTAVITAQRSSVLDAAVAGTTARSAAADTIKSALDDLQSIFSITSSGDEGSGIGVAMSSFFSAMQSVAAAPLNAASRQSAFSAAQAVANAFQSTSLALSQQSANLDGSIQDAVQGVNALTASIAELNGQISVAGSPADRDSLQDLRAAQIEGLSRFLGLQQTANSDGSISLFTSSGGALVVGSLQNALSSNVIAGSLHLYVQGNDITAGLSGGKHRWRVQRT